jgi:hypothetical protein
MGRRHDRDDDAPSWRDIDRGRDESRHTDQNKPAFGDRRANDHSYKARLDKAWKERAAAVFDNPERNKAGKKIQEAASASERKEAAEVYLSEFGVPEDFETLMAMAEVKDDAVFAQVLPPMAEQWEEQPASRRKIAVQMLQMRLMRVRDNDARKLATSLIDKG